MRSGLTADCPMQTARFRMQFETWSCRLSFLLSQFAFLLSPV